MSQPLALLVDTIAAAAAWAHGAERDAAMATAHGVIGALASAAAAAADGEVDRTVRLLTSEGGRTPYTGAPRPHGTLALLEAAACALRQCADAVAAGAVDDVTRARCRLYVKVRPIYILLVLFFQLFCLQIVLFAHFCSPSRLKAIPIFIVAESEGGARVDAPPRRGDAVRAGVLGAITVAICAMQADALEGRSDRRKLTVLALGADLAVRVDKWLADRPASAAGAAPGAAPGAASRSAFASSGAGDNLYAALTRHPIVVGPFNSLPPVLVFKIERPARSEYTFSFDSSIQLHAPYVARIARSAEEHEAAAAASVRAVGRETRSAGGAACPTTEVVATTIVERSQTLVDIEAECGVEAVRGLLGEAHDAIENAARAWGGRYALRAVVVHKTNHYTTYVREGDSEAKWNEFDDHYVTRGKSLAAAQRVWFGGQHVETQARMLFYERVSASAELPAVSTLSANDPAAHFNEALEKILRRFADSTDQPANY